MGNIKKDDTHSVKWIKSYNYSYYFYDWKEMKLLENQAENINIARLNQKWFWTVK
jgi:hypothetical protein